MPQAPRNVVLGTRTSRETKAQFAALAAQQGLTESALLAHVVDQVVAVNAVANDRPLADEPAGPRRSNERVTLRLRRGDRALAEVKAASKRMKTSTYLAMLVHTHVRGSPAIAPAEVEELRCMAGQLAALGRQLRTFAIEGRGRPASETSLPQLLTEVGSTVESVREVVAAVVRENLKSWEADHA